MAADSFQVVTGQTQPVPVLRAYAPGSPEEDLGWVGWTRFVAICSVVAIHTVGYTAILENARTITAGTAAIIMDIGSIYAVPLFVMLSGALTLNPAKFQSAGSFLRHRTIRLVPAIVFWHLFYVGFRIWVLGNDLGFVPALQQILNGKLVTALYFFWIVLGLTIVSPVLIPWIRDSRRRAVLIGGAVACLIPTLTVATQEFRGGTISWVNTPWTWWIPYTGLFIVGWGLRGVILRGWALWTAVAVTLGLGALLIWQWRNPAAPGWLQTIAPVTYYGLSVHLYAIVIFLVAQSLIRPHQLLGFLTGPRLTRIGRELGDATLGVFALHIAVLMVVMRYAPIVGGVPGLTSTAMMLSRYLVVLISTYTIVLLVRRIPVIRTVF